MNSREVEHLSKFAGEWWDSNGPMRGLHALNSLRVPFVREGLISTGSIPKDQLHTSNVLEGIKCLEVGCGAGILTEALASLKAKTVGIDPSEELINVAKSHASKNLNIEYVCSTIEEYGKNFQNHFDAVIVSEVLEHIDDKKAFLDASLQTLKPGGSLFVTTFSKTIPSLLGGVIAAEYIFNLLPRNTHDWNLFIKPSDLEKILFELNCQTLSVQGFCYEFWNNSMVWQKSKDINYALHAIKEY